MNRPRLLHLVGLLIACGGAGCERAIELTPPGQTYVTRESLEPDKLASIWLIKRHVDPQARFIFVASDVPLTNGIPFDTPEAAFRRQANLSCFEAILRKHPVADPAIRHLGELIHDIEINYWGEKRFTASKLLTQELRAVIGTNSTRYEAAMEKSFEIFDRLVRDTNIYSSPRF